jgi:thioredoxin-dependent peroxiredoxin
MSADTVKAQASFKTKYKLNFDLLSDPKFETLEAYGARRMKKFMGRTFLGIVRSTYLIGPDGKLEKIWDKVSAKGHAAEVFDEISKKIIAAVTSGKR